MNILFEIADKDLLFIILAFVGLLIFGTIIFFAITKKNKKENPFAENAKEEHFDKKDKPSELFTNIKPETKEQEDAKNELERVFNQMAKDLENENKSREAIEEFEREQEENAIISYQELIKQAEMKRLQQEHMQEPRTNAFEEKAPKQANIFEEMKAMEEDNIKELEKNKKEVSEEPKKFKNSEIISPIFGVQKEGKYNTKVREIPKHSKEQINIDYDEDDDFLNSLKEFRNNL